MSVLRAGYESRLLAEVRRALLDIDRRLGEPKREWTPTFNNLTLGNGTSEGTYHLLPGKLCHIAVKLTWGTTTSASGGLSTDFPPNITPDAGLPAVGSVYVDDSSTVNEYIGVCRLPAGDTSIFLYAEGAASNLNINATHPMTFADGDGIEFSLIFPYL